MNGRASSPVLVGRGEYLAMLDVALARAGDGTPSTVLIGGEAGIGKTRLTSEFAARAADAGTRVLVGACLDMGAEGLPFAPFSAMLRELVRTMGADSVAGLLPGHATREVARLLPEFGAMERDTEASVSRARLFEQILALLERLADERPVMLVIEDAHWADRSTRDLLAFLVGSQQVLDRVLIVVTYRSDDLHRTHPLRPLLAELGRLSWVERIELPRLARLQADELAARILGHELAPSVADEVYRRAEGNPLFVEELLSRDGEPNAQLPESLRDLLLAAVRRLPEETQDVLRAASAAGPGIEHPLLAVVTGLLEVRGHLKCHMGRDDGYADLEAALELVPAQRDGVARARVLHTLAGHLPDPDGPRGRAAAEEALALARRSGDPAALATALYKLAIIESGCGQNTDAAALDLLAQARQAAERAEGYEPRLNVAVGESHVLEGMGRHEDAARVAQAAIAGARDRGMPRATAALLAINMAEPLVALGRWDEAIEVIEHALALSPPPSNRGGLQVLAGLVALRRGDLSSAGDLAVAARASISQERRGGKTGLQYWLPLTQFEIELRLAEGRAADAVAVTGAAAGGFALESYPRYAWPLLAVAARACAVAWWPAGTVLRGTQATQGGELLGQLRTLAAAMPASGPAERASQLTFTAEAVSDPGAALAGPATGRTALARWDAAAVAWDGVRQPYSLAVALLRAAEAALTAGDRDGAGRRLRRAAELADSLGAHPLGEQIRVLARNGRITLAGQAGENRREEPRDRGYRGLTAREFEVLRHVAAGRSNPEIAAKLFISAKTASVHVSNILTKLSVSSRGEAAAAAHRLRLFDPGADGAGG